MNSKTWVLYPCNSRNCARSASVAKRRESLFQNAIFGQARQCVAAERLADLVLTAGNRENGFTFPSHGRGKSIVRRGVARMQ